MTGRKESFVFCCDRNACIGSVIFGGGDRLGRRMTRAIVMVLFASAMLGNEVGLFPDLSLFPLFIVILFFPSYLSVSLYFYLSIHLTVCLSAFVCLNVCLSISLVYLSFFSLYITLSYRLPAFPYLPPPVGGLSHCCSITVAYIMLLKASSA